MKILHVLETLSPRYGGPVAVLRSLARAQVRRGDTVTVATTDSADADFAALVTQGVRVARFGVQLPALKFSVAMAREIPALVAAHDMLHVHGLYRFPPTYAAWTARRLNAPYVIRPFGSLDPFMYKQSSKNLILKRIYEKLFDLPNLRAASAIHYTSAEERRRVGFLRLTGRDFVAPNGLDWDDYEIFPERGAFRRSIGIGESTKLILFLGRINFKKGLDLLIPAFASVRAAFPDAILALVGPDNEGYGKKVRADVAARGLEGAVIFVGMLNGPAVRAAYVDADLFTLPSYAENFGMSVVEAMACGTAVVISDQVNIHADVTAAGAGLIVPCDAARLGAALCFGLANPASCRQMGARGRAWAKTHYSWGAIVEALDREYQTILESKHFSFEKKKQKTFVT
jgi:glycosyltransferase involved in cell wall biosynthesis